MTKEEINVTPAPLGENPFSNVVGHTEHKQELINILKWFENAEELTKKGVKFPHGCILYGAPGNGKSLLIREFIRYANTPTFMIKGDEEVPSKEIYDTFAKARAEKKAIVVIDELDLLINKERRVVRALQECIDGVESCNNVLVLCACNDMDAIPDALTRSGRLEKQLRVGYIKDEFTLELLKRNFSKFGVELPNDTDEEELINLLSGNCCSTIEAIANDVVLRNGFENITYEKIIDSYFNATGERRRDKEIDFKQVCYHEAAHSVIANLYPKYYTLRTIKINGQSGALSVKENDDALDDYEKFKAFIHIALAGNLAEKYFFKTGGIGCFRDLDDARKRIYNMVNCSGFKGCHRTLPPCGDEYVRTETQIKRRNNEVIVERLFRKYERETKRLVRKHHHKIQVLGDILFEKKRLRTNEIIKIINEN